MLIELHLNETLITELPSSLKNLKELRTLEINNVKIKRFPPEICHLLKLENLSACDNGLTELPGFFSDL